MCMNITTYYVNIEVVHMYLLYFIGNGFDLNVGLKTKYADFLNDYLSISSPNETVQAGKNLVQQEMKTNIDTWADMEIALGKLSSKFPIDNGIENFLMLYNDIIVELSKYLKQQEAKVNLDGHTDEIARSFSAFLNTPERFLEEIPSQQVTQTKSVFSQEMYSFRFVNFNYTAVFDKCIRCYLDNGHRPAHANPTIVIKDNLGEIIHIHGTVDNLMILGVNDDGQILNRGFRVDKFRNRFIKPQINSVIDRANDTRVNEFIDQSKIIVIYGMSIGSSDKIWWSKLGKWLVDDARRQLVIFMKNSNYSPILPCNYIDAVEQAGELFVSYCDDARFDAASMKRIHVVMNSDVFPFKLIES